MAIADRTEAEFFITVKDENKINDIRFVLEEIKHPRILSTRKYKNKLYIVYVYSTSVGLTDKIKMVNYIRGMIRVIRFYEERKT